MAVITAASKARGVRLLLLSHNHMRTVSRSPGTNPLIFVCYKPLSPYHLQFPFLSRPFSANPINGDRIVADLLAEVEREKQHEKEERRKKGLELLDEDEDYMGVGPLIEKLEKRKNKELAVPDHLWEPTDTDSDEDDERFSPEELQKNANIFDKKCKQHAEYLKKFSEAETLDDAHKWMTKINKFEERHLKLPLEYKVIGDMMNRLKESMGKERFILLQKLNRAVKLIEIKEAYDPNNPANFGLIKHQQISSPNDIVDSEGFEQDRQIIQAADMDEDEKDFNDLKEQDDIYTKKVNAIEKEIEEKLAQLDHTFGKKGRFLEQEIKELVDERNSLAEKKRKPLYRKGFDVKVINVNRTCKVTKGGQIAKFTAILATGNFHGVIGFAKAKGPNAKIAIQKAYEKCFQNLHYVERYKEHTIAHAIQAKYERTKIYLWPAPKRTGMVAATNTVETVLWLAGFCNVKTKIIGSRNPLNLMKALFIALNAIETPNDIQEKFGRTVVETYLL